MARRRTTTTPATRRSCPLTAWDSDRERLPEWWTYRGSASAKFCKTLHVKENPNSGNLTRNLEFITPALTVRARDHGRKKGGRGRENPAFQSSHEPCLREIQNTPSSPRRPALPAPPGAIRGRFPSDERGIHHPRPEKPLYGRPVRSFRDRKGRKPRISGQSEAIRG